MKIECRSLSKRFEDKKTVLNQMNLCDDFNTLALIGRSGCGKSTFLRIVGGLLPPSSGQVWLDGEPVQDSQVYRKNVGFVFQQGGLFHHLSAKENITLPLIKVHRLSQIDAEDRADKLLKRFGLENEAAKMPAQLSGGQQQRIAIARAVAPKPKILLLDEPTSSLDPEYTTQVLDMIDELAKEGLSFIIATHEMGFALHACEKAAFLNDGTISEYSNSSSFFGAPKTEELKGFLSKLFEWNV